MDFQTIFTYRETETETIPLDDAMLVKVLIAMGIQPTKSETNGRKLRFHFIKEEADPALEKYQRAKTGIAEALFIDVTKFIVAETIWNDAITMMHALKPQK